MYLAILTIFIDFSHSSQLLFHPFNAVDLSTKLAKIMYSSTCDKEMPEVAATLSGKIMSTLRQGQQIWTKYCRVRKLVTHWVIGKEGYAARNDFKNLAVQHDFNAFSAELINALTMCFMWGWKWWLLPVIVLASGELLVEASRDNKVICKKAFLKN